VAVGRTHTQIGHGVLTAEHLATDELRVYWFEIFECARKIALVWCVSPQSLTSAPFRVLDDAAPPPDAFLPAACLSSSRKARLGS
jgi:hypothetical protein